MEGRRKLDERENILFQNVVAQNYCVLGVELVNSVTFIFYKILKEFY